jgi:ribonuclease E
MAQGQALPEGADPQSQETAEAREGREGGRRRRRGSRGGRDRDEQRTGDEAAEGQAPLLDGATGAEPSPGDFTSAESTASEASAAAPGTESQEAEGADSRRRGRGRDRNRRDRRDTADQAATAEQGESAAILEAQATPAVEASPEPAPSQVSDVRAAESTPAAALPQPASEVSVQASAANPATVAQSYELPLGQLQALAESAGLQWVNSDAQKIAAAQTAMAQQAAPAPLGREPVIIQLKDEGPLVLVETRKDLSQIKLPFDAA